MIKYVFYTMLFCIPFIASAKWEIKEASLYDGGNDTVKLKLTAYSDGVYRKSSFSFLYHKLYSIGDTLIVRPYYIESMIGSGFKNPVTKVNDINLGILSKKIKYVCVQPYDVSEVDTNNYPPTAHPPNSCMSLATLTVKLRSLNKSISLFPNPTNGVINVRGIHNVSRVSIYATDGQFKKEVNGYSPTIDISLFPVGVYFIKIETDTSIVFERVVKR